MAEEGPRRPRLPNKRRKVEASCLRDEQSSPGIRLQEYFVNNLVFNSFKCKSIFYLFILIQHS